MLMGEGLHEEFEESIRAFEEQSRYPQSAESTVFNLQWLQPQKNAKKAYCLSLVEYQE